METLLFIHEYVEIKSILKIYFPDIMQELSKEYSDARYELKLPDNSNRNFNINDMNSIPQSRIAQQLNGELKEAGDNWSNVTIIVCNNIIIAFKRIFDKYVDSNHATFMINISSQHRKILTQLLDCEYYYYNFVVNNRDNNMMKNNVKRRSRLSKLLNRRSTINVKNEDIKKRKSLINAQFEDFIRSISGNYKSDDENINQSVNKQIYKWVLEKLILAMEPSVKEISNLMNDSFLRFKINKRDLFLQLCQQAANTHV